MEGNLTDPKDIENNLLMLLESGGVSFGFRFQKLETQLTFCFRAF
jgi:hypothetical protein